MYSVMTAPGALKKMDRDGKERMKIRLLPSAYGLDLPASDSACHRREEGVPASSLKTGSQIAPGCWALIASREEKRAARA